MTESTGQVDWLRRYAASIRFADEPAHGNDVGLLNAANRIEALEAEVARLREALEPFACRTGGFLGNITDADVDRARAALAGDAP